ncbi:NAD(P)-dependent oxidoreductase [Chitiniphilus shinanonensis]|uniref:dTDP-4-dehydrorhamnose reductase n=2 Tax=Chitiniphilus shinanonensis TaxID=553088 RepID=A0ABQ6BTD8_9NEIS|nr:NAD(P)-dependent oxidoreductase [Chitiniphilus shinanonensis]
MRLPTILLTGKHGQVGFELQRSLSVVGRVVAVDRDDCDLTDQAAIAQLLKYVGPDVIINPAAHTAVDRAESEIELATQINVHAPTTMAHWATVNKALLIHYSTDYVFDGKKDGWYSEESPPNPQSIYGKTKLAGENAIRASGCQHLILRTSWVYGAHGSNFLKTMLRLMKEREVLSVVADQIGCPTNAELLADITAQLVAQYWQSDDRSAFAFGTYHAVATGETTWYEYAKTINQLASQMGWSLKATSDKIRPIPASAFPAQAPRPLNSRLDTNKLQTTFNIALPTWQQGVAQVLTLLRAGVQE